MYGTIFIWLVHQYLLRLELKLQVCFSRQGFLELALSKDLEKVVRDGMGTARHGSFQTPGNKIFCLRYTRFDEPF